ncbi:2-amino-4-hydroxy-6-hydroxymethyldihydropteridine diphosphokinase [Coxiella endosymbiont of Dermacentor marginatus]|uniref:2-amino-4-hydroxy-6- hydroxymethyldihydropteridine diphosphokinase n=1 Tax=Coxiella endosymbiont of Dermacentor marginatus TaxID=1656159 RepID=UPI0022237F4B|nr:2-amino-4-hydroxy-6-hydroxymethyldihydropteridine diphosphokinase [Coxiella endosymbiont of Dermacentor marginatus]
MVVVYIGIGSNLNSPIKQVKTAIVNLAILPKTMILNHSSFYQSRPVGPQDQPNYINAVVTLETRLSPEALLKALQALEENQGRERSGTRWRARTLDLDILLYGKSVIQTETLSIPHPHLKVREFVLYPLFEIAPNLILPTGDSVLALKALCPKKGIKKLIDRISMNFIEDFK